jgi:Zn-dependent peptidase ImmA (M78 family)
MEQIRSINPDRIAWCCADFGMTPRDLASKLHLAPDTLDEVLAGEKGLTPNQLQKLAAFFGRGMLFFLEDSPVDERRVHTAQFRTLANQKHGLEPALKRLIERVERHRETYLSLLEDLDDQEAHRFVPPKLSGNTPKQAAEIVRAWLGLGESNNFETYRKAVEAQGLLVFRSNGYNGKWQIPSESPVLGFTLYDAQCPVIVVRKAATESRQSFTLMHELGHVLLHKASSIDDLDDLNSHEGMEREANEFAGHLLVPDVFLGSISDGERPAEVSQFDAWLEKPRKRWGVSGEVILRRLMDQGRLPKSEYAAYRAWRAALQMPREEGRGVRTYRHREPVHIFGSAYVGTVLDALNSQKITLNRASAHLDDLKISDLHKLEDFYAGV